MTGARRWCYEHPRPAVGVDVVLLDAERARVLLVRRAHEPFEGRWALPGGFVDIDEDLEAAARRELAEETGIAAAGLRQVGAFGRPDRDPRGRVISVAWVATAPDGATASAGSDAAEARWFPLAALPPLAFDHGEILAAALARG